MGSPPNLPPENRENLFPSPQHTLTMEVMPRHLKMHSLSESELDTLAAGGSSLHMGFFGACAGAFISFMIVLYTGGVTDPNKHSTFVMLAFSTGILSLYFGFRGVMDHLSAKRLVREIKQGSSKRS